MYRIPRWLGGLSWSIALAALALAVSVRDGLAGASTDEGHGVLTGESAYGDWRTDAVGLRRLIRPSDMPLPYATRSAADPARIVRRPAEAWPKVPPGFKVDAFAAGLANPRLLRTAPNGDIFVADSRSGSIQVLRPGNEGQPAIVSTYVDDLNYPFGIAFYPPGPDPHYLYVACVNAVLRYSYKKGDVRPSDAPTTIIASIPTGGHVTRDVIFSPDGKKMFVSVGSASNDAEGGVDETGRADILEFNPDGSDGHRFATGIRNPVSLALHPVTGDLWTAVNERDGLGDNLPPDYVTRVKEGGFFGWPWYYIGANQDPRHKGERPDLRGEITVPDVLIQPHSAPLGLAVYTGGQFPAEYRNDIFVALHGSWNRSKRTGYKLVRVVLHDGKPTGEYEDFLISFVTPAGDVWGRPVGVAVAADGALLVSDDVGNTVWRISYAGPR